MRGAAQGRDSDSLQRREHASSILAALFRRNWTIRPGARRELGGPDLIVRRRGRAYAVRVKAAVEGRGDRLVPLLAQAVLESRRAAGRNGVPLAVVAAPRVAPRTAEQVIRFAEEYAPNAAVGVIGFDGFAMFRGPNLEELNSLARPLPPGLQRSVRASGGLFSDLNQWMLKVLLAPEISEGLLRAPRGQYANASQLARAADVSIMTAFRLVRQLQQEGYLDERANHLRLVRRDDLLRRWQASAERAVREVPMRFVLPGAAEVQLGKVLAGGRACLALFAAADALRLGHVSGVPRYVYVERLRPSSLEAWKSLRPSAAGEPPDVIVRQAPAPRSVFRGMVQSAGGPASDVLQVWLDVAAHPSRGREQADHIRKRALQRLIEGRD